MRGQVMKVALAAAAMTVAVAAFESGCIPFGCGVGPVIGQDGGTGGHVTDAGVVVFDPTLVGASVQYQVAVADSADTDETLLGASFTGEGANDFQVITSFPVAIPAGTQTTLTVEFTPAQSGGVDAQLLLQTMNMGVSPPITVEGVGLLGDGG